MTSLESQRTENRLTSLNLALGPQRLKGLNPITESTFSTSLKNFATE